MKIDFQVMRKVFAARVVSRALLAFDKATMVVVGVCWGGALLLLVFTLYTLSLSMTAKREVATAAAGEPVLPVIASKPLETTELKPLVDRLQKRFPDILLTLGQDKTLTITSSDGGKFRLWLTVLSYIDTISPQYRWTIKEFCVGLKCGNAVPMRAVLGAEKISFTLPSAADE